MNWLTQQAALSEQIKQVLATAQNPILSRLGLSEEQWIILTTEFEQHFFMQLAQSTRCKISKPIPTENG